MLKKIKSFLFENKTAKQTVAKNTIWLGISNLGGRALKAIIVLYAARALGTADYGVFSYAVTLAGFFTLFIDPGINTILMREVPKATDVEKRQFFSTMLILKLALIAIGIAFMLLVAPFFSTLPGAKALLPIVALIITFDTFREFFSSFMRGREKMEWEAGVFLFTNLIIVIAGLVLLSISRTPLALSWAYAIGSILGALLATWVIRDYLVKIFSYFTSKLILPIIRSAWPFTITGVLGILLTSADILIISWMRSASEVGIYSAAVRIVQLLYIIPTIFQYSTLPLIAQLANHDNERFRSVFERTLGIVFLVSIPLAMGGIVLGTPIMSFLFGAAYAPGALSFKILMLTMLFDFPITVISAGIFAYDRQKGLIISSAIGGAANVALDIVFIPPFGIAGSAVATLISQAIINWYLWRTMNKINHFTVLRRLGKIALSGILMAILAFLLLTLGVPLIANILVSGLFYIILLKLTQEPLIGEVIGIVRPLASKAPAS